MILQKFERIITNSGHFKDVITGRFESEVNYSTDQYLTLLNTYSPHFKLDLNKKTALFNSLKSQIDNGFWSNLRLFYTSAFHIPRNLR